MKWIVPVALGVALIASGCHDPVPPATPTPAPATIPETFTGTLLPLGTSTNTFLVQRAGGIQVSLTSISPAASVGIGVGTPSGASCLTLDHMTVVAGPNAQMIGTATVPGNFCVLVFDVGNLVESVNYTVVVLHS
ncbi:MAG TPA: hypothetical protein VKE51_13890 [Vicinamibacterales bacterium]|nr:hypothetical protein [Vicinamibacterales bacterium]